MHISASDGAGDVNSEGDATRGLKLDDLQGAFIILTIGYLLSLSTLLCELVYFNGLVRRLATKLING